MSPSSGFSHFRNTRHERWTLVGVADPDSPTDDVATVEIFTPGSTVPKLELAVSDVPQFIAGLIATALPGDLTRG